MPCKAYVLLSNKSKLTDTRENGNMVSPEDLPKGREGAEEAQLLTGSESEGRVL